MINVPSSFYDGPFTKNFKEMVDFFNDLEEKLQYPNCSGKEDQERVLRQAMKELTLWGKI
jgi:hypothetical protein